MQPVKVISSYMKCSIYTVVIKHAPESYGKWLGLVRPTFHSVYKKCGQKNIYIKYYKTFMYSMRFS